MKQFYLLLVCIIFMLQTQVISASIVINNEDGFDVYSSVENAKFDEDFNYLLFDFECKETAEYYISAWIQGAMKGRVFVSYDCLINNKQTDFVFQCNESTWKMIPLTNQAGRNQKILLRKGKNQISIKAENPVIPNIEYIRISKQNENNSSAIENEYNNFVEHAINSSLPIRSTTSQTPVQTAGNYICYRNVPFSYSESHSLYFSTGGHFITITASANSAFAYTLKFFHSSFSTSTSRTADANGNISFNTFLPSAGIYRLLLCSENENSSGTVNISIDNFSYSNCPVTYGYYPLDAITSYTPRYNYFTTNLSGNSALWLSRAADMAVCAYNDNYSTQGNHQWYLNARINTNFSYTAPVSGVWLFASSSMPLGQCDLYLKCRNAIDLYSTLSNDYPDLTSDDAILSDYSTSTYNCISWSIDHTNYWEWPCYSTSSYYVPNAVCDIEHFDNMYNLNGYTRIGATLNNAVIILWGRRIDDCTTEEVGHASITNNSNSIYPHGYAWESKSSAGPRFFHPKEDVGAMHNSILYYYIVQDNNDYLLIFEELDSVFLQEVSHMISRNYGYLIEGNELIKKIESIKCPFEDNNYNLRNNLCYKEVIVGIQDLGNDAWPLLLYFVLKFDRISLMLLEDLGITQQYEELLEDVKHREDTRSYKIIRSPRTNAILFLVELIDKYKDGEKNNHEEFIMPQTVIWKVVEQTKRYFTIQINSDDSISFSNAIIYDVEGTFISNMRIVRLYDNSYALYSNKELPTGRYILNLNINGRSSSQKVSVE